jgi:hypothetical protein
MVMAGAPDPVILRANLPADHARIRRPSVLDEDQPAVSAQHPPDLPKRAGRVGDAAQRPGRHHGIDRLARERDALGRSLKEFDREAPAVRPSAGLPKERGRGRSP